MAFLQSDLPPSTAPISTTRRASARVIPATQQQDHSRLVGRLLAGLVGAAVLAILGIAAARATESLAVGIMAADFVFLTAVAGWSTVAGAARH